jgi:alkaline phosphatase D
MPGRWNRALAQDSNPLGGASRPVVDMSLKRDWQYKRVHQLALRYLLLDRTDEATNFLQDYLKEHPDDAETYFMLGLLAARQDDPQQAVAQFQQAIQRGLPPERILAGPRHLMKPITGDAFYRQLLKQHSGHLVHGPLLGNVTDHSTAVWVRTATTADVTLVVTEIVDDDSKSDAKNPEAKHPDSAKDKADAKADDFQEPKKPMSPLRSAAVGTSPESDYTAVVSIDGLKPATTYRYGIQIQDGPLLEGKHQRFRTFARPTEGSTFRIAFGGGAGYVPDNERMWDTILKFDPIAMLLLGDNVYIDDPESADMQRYTYYRRQSRPEWRRLTARSAVFTIWDDHDFSTNDSWGGPLVDKPAWKQQICWPIFRQNWANPGYGGGPEQPGCWYRFSIGDVDFIMLDCRYYRTNPKKNDPSMLGPVQMKWLKQQLRDASGTFKVICSSVPWDFRTKGQSFDTWNGYTQEREEIFSFLESHAIEGVVLLSADRHRSDAWRIERPGGYDLYEFNSSRLTNQHVHPTTVKQGALFSYNKLQSFGLVTFDTKAEDPCVSYDVVNIDGKIVESLKVLRSQLKSG